MFDRLRDNWVYGGFLAAVMLLVLTPVLSRGWSTALLLIWLQLPVYMLHQFEEHDGDRFRLAVNATVGGGKEVLTRFDTFVINIAGVWGINALAFTLAATGRAGSGLVAVYLSLINSLGHCAQAVALRRYNPGLATSIVLFMPLGIGTLWFLSDSLEVTTGDHLVGFVAALGIHALIVARVIGRRRSLT